MSKSKIPAATIIRLSVYQRYLKKLLARGVKIVSSNDLAKQANVNPAQLRKDLSYFGRFGVRGVGYSVASLLQSISGILGVLEERTIILVGTGPIAQALVRQSVFSQQGYRFEAVFDIDPKNVGKPFENDLVVRALNELMEFSKKTPVELAVLAVPSDKTQEAADKLVECGIRGILNFSPTRITVPRGVSVQYVDFTILLDTLTYNIARNKKVERQEGQEEGYDVSQFKWKREHSWPIVQSNNMTA